MCAEVTYDHTPCLIRRHPLRVSFLLCRKFLDETLAVMALRRRYIDVAVMSRVRDI